MRKCVWTGTAVAVLALAGMYLAADRAVRYPDSWLGQCARAIVNMGPVFGRGDTNARTEAKPCEARCETKPMPAPLVEACVAFEPLVVELSLPAPVGPPLPPEDGTEESGAPSLTPGRVTGVITPSGGEESDAPVPAMPLCPEDDVNAGRRMPYADQDEEPAEQVSMQEVLDMVRRSSLGRFLFGAPVNPAQENVPPVAEPLEESSEPDEAPGCREDPHRHHHYPSCPYTGRYSPPYRPLPPLPRITPAPPAPNTATPER